MKISGNKNWFSASLQESVSVRF